jgi:predicted transcriptional regulator
MSGDWTHLDLAIGRAEALVLEYAIERRFANEDLEPEFFLAEVERECRLSRPSIIAALRSLTARAWLTMRAEDDRVAASEGRGPRTYYELSDLGAQVSAVLLGPRAFVPGAYYDERFDSKGRLIR